ESRQFFAPCQTVDAHSLLGRNDDEAASIAAPPPSTLDYIREESLARDNLARCGIPRPYHIVVICYYMFPTRREASDLRVDAPHKLFALFARLNVPDAERRLSVVVKEQVLSVGPEASATILTGVIPALPLLSGFQIPQSSDLVLGGCGRHFPVRGDFEMET